MRAILKKAAAVLMAVAMTPAWAGGVMHLGNGAEPASMDPHFITGTWESSIVGGMFMGLTTSDAKARIIPGLATSWDISDDGKTYTFDLRDGAKWSDGQPITAEDFVFSLQRILRPETAAKYAFILYPIKNAEAVNKGEMKADKIGVRAINSDTLEIQLEAPTPFFLEQLTHYTAFPVPMHAVKKHGKDWTKKENIVVSGSFILDEWMPQSHLKVVKNPMFFDADNVSLDGIVYYPTEDKSAELKRFRAGELHATWGVPSGQYAKLKADFGDNFRVAPYLGVYYYPINVNKIKDVNVRRALSMAVNREVISEKILGEGQTPAYGWVPPGINNYVPADKQPQLPFKGRSYKENVADAKRILQKAGYSKDKPLKVQLKYNTNEAHKKVALAIAAMWKPLGVEVEMFNQEAKVHYNDLKNNDFDIGRAGWIGDYNDPTTFTDLQLDNAYNYSRYIDQELIANAKKAAKITDLDERARVLAQVEQAILDGHAVIPIYYYVSKHLVSDQVQGWEDNIQDRHRPRYLSLKGE